MPLTVGLADFQLVHPTETEPYTTAFPTGQFEPGGVPEGKGEGLIRPVVEVKSHVRRKRASVERGQVVIKRLRVVSKKDPVELTFEIDPKTGRALCAVSMDMLPQLPMDCEFEVYGPKGLIERGNIRCGGNEAVHTREVVLNA